MADRICSVEHCGGTVLARGWCCKHYQRWWSHGDVTTVLPRLRRSQKMPPVPGHLPCTGCWEMKPEEDFCLNPKAANRNGRAHRCRDCRGAYYKKKYAENKDVLHERSRWASTKYRFGITRQQYEALVEAQGGVCRICGEPDTSRRLCIDHDHACCPGEKTCGRCIRGLLCNLCNRLIGLARDNPDVLEAAAGYLRR